MLRSLSARPTRAQEVTRPLGTSVVVVLAPLLLGAAACGVSERGMTADGSPSSPRLTSSPTATPAAPTTAAEAPLLKAARAGDLVRAKGLAAGGADVDAADASGQNPYLVVAATGDVAFLQWLLDQGADPLVTDQQGGTGLIHASDAGNVETVRVLLGTAEADRIDRVNAYGWTALLEAILLGGGDRDHSRIVAMLLEAGADPSIADADGVTPLQHARDRGYDAMAQALTQALALPAKPS